jgi:hypothetical protein
MHGLNPRALLKELEVHSGEAVDYAEASEGRINLYHFHQQNPIPASIGQAEPPQTTNSSVDSARYRSIPFSCIMARLDYESAALPAALLRPLYRL